jgi:5-methylcytosine-specific restriction enzyme subunit McrC
MGGKIPIRNIYFLLCYAWDRLAEGNLIDVSALDSTELVDLFAAVLLSGTHHVIRRGLDQGYQAFEGELASIRGRVDVAGSSRKMLLTHGRACCVYDELNVNTLPNRILKATLRHLTHIPILDKSLRMKLRGLIRSLGDIEDIHLTKLSFRQIQLNGNKRFYKFLLNVCELVQSAWLVDEAAGAYRFRDFLRDERQMARLFESFIFNFYRIERPEMTASRDRIDWTALSEEDPELQLLPTMLTDVVLRDNQRTIVIDAKYYKETLQSHYDRETVRSLHLYQLFAYLKNLEARGGIDAQAEGILLYPVVDRNVRLSYQMPGHMLRVRTVDLSCPWEEIHNELLDIIV